MESFTLRILSKKDNSMGDGLGGELKEDVRGGSVESEMIVGIDGKLV